MTADGKSELVVVGVDGSECGDAALGWAGRYAEATGATIKVVLAWHYPAAAGAAPVGVTPPSAAAEVEKSREEIIDDAVTRVLGAAPAVKIERKAVYGHPAQVLINESAGADLLVVGNRGHGGFTGMMLGSVSTHCVTHAHCPVTVIRAG
jgi:nucleotide-binding universal stress UspA family protein